MAKWTNQRDNWGENQWLIFAEKDEERGVKDGTYILGDWICCSMCLAQEEAQCVWHRRGTSLFEDEGVWRVKFWICYLVGYHTSKQKYLWIYGF